MITSLALAEIRNLRRYAFTLLGHRVLGDSAVEAAIDKTLTRAVSASGDAISRLEFYKYVNEAAGTTSDYGNVTAAAPGAGIHTRLLRLPLRQRQVAALHDVVGLPYSDIASIMSMTAIEARQIYINALSALRHEPIAVLIIEDEALVALELRKIVTSLGLAVAGTAANRTEALRIARRARPKLILADYHLSGESGVEVVKAIRKRFDTRVIYVTAHAEAVVARLDTAGDIVISKPFSPRTVAHAVETHLAA
jgi:CheY-like chemotaxis protein